MEAFKERVKEPKGWADQVEEEEEELDKSDVQDVVFVEDPNDQTFVEEPKDWAEQVKKEARRVEEEGMEKVVQEDNIAQQRVKRQYRSSRAFCDE